MAKPTNSASGKPYFNKTAKKQLAKGEIPTALPGRRYERQLKQALDEIADNYKRSDELESYADGTFGNGVPHLRISDQGDSAYIELGNMSARVKFPEGLTDKQKQAYIEFHVYGMYQRGKDKTDGNGKPLLGYKPGELEKRMYERATSEFSANDSVNIATNTRISKKQMRDLEALLKLDYPNDTLYAVGERDGTRKAYLKHDGKWYEFSSNREAMYAITDMVMLDKPLDEKKRKR